MAVRWGILSTARIARRHQTSEGGSSAAMSAYWPASSRGTSSTGARFEGAARGRAVESRPTKGMDLAAPFEKFGLLAAKMRGEHGEGGNGIAARQQGIEPGQRDIVNRQRILQTN